MNKFLVLVVASLAILCLSHELEAANVPLASMAQQQQEPKQEVESRKIQIIQDIKAYIMQHPNLQLQRLNKKTPVNRSQSIRYTLGNRVSGKERQVQEKKKK